MGFFLELGEEKPRYYAEARIPLIFWELYAVLGFALLCMGIAAFSIFSDLLSADQLLDKFLVGSFALFVVMYILVGIKLAWIRKFVDFSEDTVKWGFRAKNWILFSRQLPKKSVASFGLEHSSPTQNTAPQLHTDAQYYIQGHWRLILHAPERDFLIDRSTEREALEPLLIQLQDWLKNS